MADTNSTSQRDHKQPEVSNTTSGEDGISLYYEALLEEVERAVEVYNEEAVESLRSNDYESVKQIMEWSQEVRVYHRRVKELQSEWAQLVSKWDVDASVHELPLAKIAKKFPEALRTPGHAFRIPILETLVGTSGVVTHSRVLSEVFRRMESTLNDHDYQPLLSNPDQPRWRNTAIWCLDQLAVEGLISSASARGTWEITEQGMSVLAEQRQAVARNTRNGSADDASSLEFDPDQDGDNDACKSSFGLQEILDETVEGFNVEA